LAKINLKLDLHLYRNWYWYNT